MDIIKQAFQKIKQDIFLLQQQVLDLKRELNALKQEKNNQEYKKIRENQQDLTLTIPTYIPTYQSVPTHIPTHIPTHPTHLYGLKSPNSGVSTGNRGVPTDKPTDKPTNQQTDQHIENYPETRFLNEFQKATQILDSLDSIKKEIRLKFKRLTQQEMLVFSSIYTLQEQGFEEITYKIIANNLNLSQSSIRDYINKIIQKGIPIVKLRRDNKKITLSISPDLQNIANLSTIIKLREL